MFTGLEWMMLAGLGMQGAQMGMGAGGVGQQRGGILGGPPQMPQMPQTFGGMNKMPFTRPDPYRRTPILGQGGQPTTNSQYQYNPYSWWRM